MKFKFGIVTTECFLSSGQDDIILRLLDKTSIGNGELTFESLISVGDILADKEQIFGCIDHNSNFTHLAGPEEEYMRVGNSGHQ